MRGVRVGLLVAWALAAAAPASPAAGPEPRAGARVERRLGLMGTTLAITVEAADRAAALAASERAVAALEAAEARLSTWRDDTELARLNRSPVGAVVPLSPALARELAAAKACWEETEGAFDPAVGELVAAWGLRTGGRVPGEEERQAAGAASGLDGLRLLPEAAVRLRAGAVIEEGGFGKGAGLAGAAAALASSPAVRSAVLDLGGQLALVGAGRREVSIADPRRRDRPVLALTVEGGSVSTSGHGERPGHLLDPRTGAPAADFGSLTVWTADPLRADCLSTGLFVLGPERALAWAAAHPDVEVLALVREGERLRAHATPGLAGRLAARAPEIEIAYLGAPAGAQEGAATTSAEGDLASERDRLEALEQEVTELRAEIERLKRAVPETGAPADPERLAELERRIDVLAEEIEKLTLGEAAAAADRTGYGLGPAASKVYRTGTGLSVGGYGELLYEGFDSARDDGARSGRTDRFDLLRGVLYFGYKWNDRWLLNSEIEYEHASTGEGGEVAVEFAYVDYLWRPALGLRAGLLLVPMGFLNELHEPTVFLGARRPGVENALLPTTWRENGLGVFGDAGALTYRAYVVNGLDASGFTAGGLRGGRQKGAQAKAEDFALVGRLDWRPVPGLLFGGSAYLGDSGQGIRGRSAEDEDEEVRLGEVDVRTRILEAHVEWRWQGLELRGLAARGELDEVAELNAALGLAGDRSVGEELEGWYVQAGYDLFSRWGRGEQGLTPYVRWEELNTQAAVPAGFRAAPANDVETLTLGVAYQPIDSVILKIDHQDFANAAGTGVDQFNVLLGYIF